MSGSVGAGRWGDNSRTNIMVGLRRDFGVIFGVIIDIIRTIWPYLAIFVLVINWYNYVPSAYLEWAGELRIDPSGNSNVTHGDVFTFLIVLFLGFCAILCAPCCCAYYLYGCLNPQSEWSWLYDDRKWDRKRKSA